MGQHVATLATVSQLMSLSAALDFIHIKEKLHDPHVIQLEHRTQIEERVKQQTNDKKNRNGKITNEIINYQAETVETGQSVNELKTQRLKNTLVPSAKKRICYTTVFVLNRNIDLKMLVEPEYKCCACSHQN